MGKTAIEGARRGNLFYCSPFRVTIVGRDIPAGPEHPLYDERAQRHIDPSRVKNIRTYGVIDAVKVRKNGKHDNGEFEGMDVLEVIDGRGRVIDCREAYRLATEAGEDPPLLKVEVARVDEDTAIGVMVSANEHRDEDTPLNKARKAMRIMRNGRTGQEVADMFGVTPQAVSNWMSILELSKKVQQAIDKKLLTAKAALALKELSHQQQDEKLSELLAQGHTDSNGKRRPPTANEVRHAANGKGQPLKFNKGAAKVLVNDQRWMDGLSPDAVALARFIAGDEDAVDQVPGLRTRLKKLAEAKAKPKAKKGAKDG